MSNDFKNDPSIVIIAVKKNGLALKYASTFLKNDREIAASRKSSSK